MLKRTVCGIVLAILLVAMLMLAFDIQPVKGETIIVPDDYSYVQEAINAASDGDTIPVSAGTYRESLYINKTLTLTRALGDENWNPHADLDENAKINILDIATAALMFGKELVLLV